MGTLGNNKCIVTDSSSNIWSPRMRRNTRDRKLTYAACTTNAIGSSSQSANASWNNTKTCWWPAKTEWVFFWLSMRLFLLRFHFSQILQLYYYDFQLFMLIPPGAINLRTTLWNQIHIVVLDCIISFCL